MELGDRKLKILQAIIKDFISTAEPVGSRTLMKKYDLGISAATIRNEMADLEEMGYLKQPHTSAGRIPSDKGYRLYVDSLMIIDKLAQKQKDIIKKSFIQSVGELEQIIATTSKILSQMTKLTSVVLSPQFEQSKLKSVQLVPIDDESVLLVTVSESGVVRNAILRMNEKYTYDNLMIINKILNMKLKGLTIGDITCQKVEDIKREMNMFHTLIDTITPVLISTLEEMVNVQLYLDGVTNIFNLPEYHNIEKARDFMEMLDKKEHIMDLLINSKDDIDVTIGKENKHEEMQDCSLVTATYKVNGMIVGKIGVIGPTRMNYEHIVSVVDYVTKNLTDLLNNR
ncbi:heat-inducible transcription repressor HrcA [Crassaminicella thermophila]|uniref:Heat-inducible transcription repressor HrcA n=1 Tax=Crassaminicella thermophila TaxID=2599308 RepID=A0A5C0SDM5_CRATE|nr:heat-inducible transcriptional repressor HrcA [Crassaminicella thermophila]QEK12371.1 heat-inducible transcription repressor HrcA [Crassaminicella thermophila]